MNVALASDHAGIELKAQLVDELRALGHQPLDLGPHEPASTDYPDWADTLAAVLADGRAERGVLVCGSGIGMSIAANRHAHIRAALATDATMARLAREHNDANVLALGARLIGPEVARDCLRAFMASDYAGGRHEARVVKLSRRS